MLNIRIKTSNAAFEGVDLPYELCRILDAVQKEIMDGNLSEDRDFVPLRDSNGNKVGFAEFMED